MYLGMTRRVRLARLATPLSRCCGMKVTQVQSVPGPMRRATVILTHLSPQTSAMNRPAIRRCVPSAALRTIWFNVSPQRDGFAITVRQVRRRALFSTHVLFRPMGAYLLSDSTPSNRWGPLEIRSDSGEQDVYKLGVIVNHVTSSDSPGEFIPRSLSIVCSTEAGA